MKVKVLQESLREKTNTCLRFVSTRVQLPVLGSFLLEAEGGKLRVTATNLEMAVSVECGADVEVEGKLVVPAKVFVDGIASLDPGALVLEYIEGKLLVESKTFKASVTCGDSGEFPDVPKELGKNKVKISTKDVLEGIDRTLFAVAADETRPILTGVLFEQSEGKTNLVATDGFRLSRFEIKGGGLEEKMIIPKAVVGELQRKFKLNETAYYSFDKAQNQVVFGVGEYVFSSRVLQGEFPDYNRIIPTSSVVEVEASRDELLSSVRVAGIFARDMSNMITLSLETEKLVIKSKSSSSGSQESEVEAKVTGLKGELVIAFNYRFLEELLSVVKGESVKMGFNDANSAGVFRDLSEPKFMHLIMPVRTEGNQ